MAHRKIVSSERRAIGKKLREARERRGWSQLYLATKLETNQTTVSRWEKGVTLPSYFFREKLCSLLSVSMEVFGGLVEVEESEFQEEEKPSLLNPENEVTDLSPPEASDAREQHLPTYWLIPYELNPYFIGREQVLEDISNIFLKEDTHSIKTCAISGLPGVGKTQVAITYAYRQRNKYQAVFWLRADTYENIISDFVDIAYVLDLPEKTSTNQTALLHAVKQWLNHHPGWLLIFDNVEHLELVTTFLPPEGSGHVILTLRSEIVGRTATKLEVHPMDLEEGAIFLLYRANITQAGALALETVTQHDQEQAKTLSQEMDGLPLALDQAGAYIEELPCSLAEYLALYRKLRIQLLQRRGAMNYGHPASIMTTISLALEKIKAVNSAAIDLLYLFAHLHPDRIQKTILRGDVPDLSPELQTLADNPALLNEALGLLSKYALIRRVPETSEPVCFRMHRLVQDILQDLLTTEAAKRQWAELTIRVVNRTLDSLSIADWQRYHEYIAHAQVCIALIEKWNIASGEAVASLSWVASYWQEQGDYAKAEPLLKKRTSMLEEVQANDLALIEDMSQRASFYMDQGAYKEAERLYLQILAMLEGSNSNARPIQFARAALYNNLGELYDRLAKYEEAEIYFIRALSLRERILGSEHELYAMTIYHLGELYSELGEYERADELHQLALRIFRQRLGPKHQLVARGLVGIGANLYRQKRFEDAKRVFKDALHIFKKSHGPNHIAVAQCLDNLGNIYADMDMFKAAEFCFHRALQIYEQPSNVNAGDTTYIWVGLAIIHAKRGQISEAKRWYEKAAKFREQVLGSDHPETREVIDMMNNLDDVYF